MKEKQYRIHVKKYLFNYTVANIQNYLADKDVELEI